MIKCNIEKQLKGASGPFSLEIEFTLAAEKTLALFGASGVGKTSILRMIAGLMTPDAGHIKVGGKVWYDSDKAINVPAQDRKVGYVFQDYALFPAMTVMENIRYAAGNQGSDLVEEVVTFMEIGDLKNQRPGLLSGGQKQRVALARALVQRPSLLLLDEPLAALDTDLRSKLQDFLHEIKSRYEMTCVLVSHDLPEIFRLADHVVKIDNSKITASGPPEEVFASAEVSGKFQFEGRVLAIDHEELISIVTVLIGDQLARVLVEQSLAHTLARGDAVMVASKAFNPILYKI